MNDTSAPKVSVVIICFNDRRRLPHAIRSVLEQTYQSFELLIVDDHSTDGSEEVALEFERRDARVTFIRHETNSGGCGAPRNTGISLARGEFLMFLDSDDQLTADALSLLVGEAERTGAELVAGGMERHHVASGLVETWYHWIYDVRRSCNRLADRPELTHDTVATNKLYRATLLSRLGLRFPVGVLYEDVIFTAHVWSSARGISLLPDVVYHWYVYPDDERSTITNQRTQQRNFTDRIAAIQRVNEVYAAQPAAVQVEADVKALGHHLRLYLEVFDLMSESAQRTFIERSSPVIRGASPLAYEKLPIYVRLMLALVLSGDRSMLAATAEGYRLGVIPGRWVSTASGYRWNYPGQNAADVPHHQEAMILALTSVRSRQDPPSEPPQAAVSNVTYVDGGALLSGALAFGETNTQEMPELFLRQRGAREIDGSSSRISCTSTHAYGWGWEAFLPSLQRGPHTQLAGSSLELIPLSQGSERHGFEVHALSGLTIEQPARIGVSRLLGDTWVAHQPAFAPLRFEIRPSKVGRLLRRIQNWLLKRGKVAE